MNNETIATYCFLPYLRHGISADNSLTTTDEIFRNSVDIPLLLNGVNIKGELEKAIESINKTVQLYGPGDIIGIESRAWIKTEPQDWVTNFEANYLPYIEFYDEDFPWRYSLGQAQENDRLMPWITLVILKEDEFEDGKNIKDKPLPFIKLLKRVQEIFPPADQLWAWAHVHINESLVNKVVSLPEDENIVTEKLDELLKRNPDLAYSRLISPRKLEANCAYHAFLIPSYELGRRAGLNIGFEDIGQSDLSAWADSEQTIFPYYHRWYFRTANIGDFEYLVNLLEPKPVDNRVGVRNMDVQNPSPNINGIIDNELKGILKLGGALKVPDENFNDSEKEVIEKYENWDQKPLYPHQFQKDLARFINLNDDYEEKSASEAINDANNSEEDNDIRVETVDGNDPLITSPLYGQWYALANRLLYKQDGTEIANNANWIHELNLDPRYRVAAGFGTSVVQKNQEAYMEKAWNQFGDIVEANALLRRAQYSLKVSNVYHEKYLKKLAERNKEHFFSLTTPLNKRILVSNKTLYYKLKSSLIPATTSSILMRKIMRPGGKVMKSLQLNYRVRSNNLISRLNSKEILVAQPKQLSEVLVDYESISQNLQTSRVSIGFVTKSLNKYPFIKYTPIATSTLLTATTAIINPTIPLLSLMGGLLVASFIGYQYLEKKRGEISVVNMFSNRFSTKNSISDLPKSPNFKISMTGEKKNLIFGLFESRESKRFKKALIDSNNLIQDSITYNIATDREKLDIELAISQSLESTKPSKTIDRYVHNGAIKLPTGISQQKSGNIFEILAFPDIENPMYKPLTNISPDLFLPNINYIGQNSISLLETNQKFIESYMVGVNHEFSRELYWRDYPTDRRGTCFRQFWDASDSILDEETIISETRNIKERLNTEDENLIKKELEKVRKEKFKDIPKIHLWKKDTDLGKHDFREKGRDNIEELVLVIRGELLKKYPTAIIYAHKAQWDTTNGEIDTSIARVLNPNYADAEGNIVKDIIKTPLYDAKVEPDIYFFGFDLTVDQAIGLKDFSEVPTNEGDRAGWFFVIKERPGEPRFGLDIEKENIQNPKMWNDLSWTHIKREGEVNGFIRIEDNMNFYDLKEEPQPSETEEKVQREEDEQINWDNQMSASDIAYILYQVPAKVAVHGAKMLKNIKKNLTS